MTMTAPPPARPAPPPAPATELTSASTAAGGPLPLAAAVVGAAVTTLTSLDGSPVWQTVRLMAGLAATVVAVAALDGLRGWRRSTLAVFIGLVGTTVGIGIGGPHLAKTGLTVTSVAALVAGFGGLVLLVGGSLGAVRRAGWWRRLLVVPLLVVLTLLSWLVFAPALVATNVPSTELGRRTPADLGLRYEDVTFPATDGVRLSAWYVPSTNGAAVVLLHGSGSTRSNVLDHAAVLARAGYGALVVDARGHGRSEGGAMDFGWYGDEDVRGAVSFLEARADVRDGRIGAVGMSMGGEEAIGALAADGRLRGVVAEGATGRTARDLGWLSDAYGVRGAVQERLSWLTYAAADLLSHASRPIPLREAVAAAAPRPVLLIAAGAVEEERWATRAIQQAAPDSVERWVVPGAGHTDGLDVAPDEWERRVTRFLDAALAG